MQLQAIWARGCTVQYRCQHGMQLSADAQIHRARTQSYVLLTFCVMPLDMLDSKSRRTQSNIQPQISAPSSDRLTPSQHLL